MVSKSPADNNHTGAGGRETNSAPACRRRSARCGSRYSPYHLPQQSVSAWLHVRCRKPSFFLFLTLPAKPAQDIRRGCAHAIMCTAESCSEALQTKNAMRKHWGERLMPMLRDRQKRPDVLAEQRRLSELVHLIRKLRWMGLEGEARRVEMTLPHATHADSVLAAPHETD
jgi:hypothetical protein